MDIADLLQTAAGAPLGPLSLTVAPDGDNAWWLNATLHNEPTVGIHLVRDPELNTLRLERQMPSEVAYARWQAAIEARPWVTDSAPMASGGVHVRYWLHANDLSLNHLLSAVADISRLTPTGDASSSASRPATPARPSTWQTLPAPPPPPPPPTPVAIAPPPPVPAAPIITPEPAQPAVHSAATPGRICQECGEPTNPEHTFCTNCGARLN